MGDRSGYNHRSVWYLVRGAIALSFYAIGHQKQERAIAIYASIALFSICFGEQF